ncbi:unnamed protein product [Rotaria socialis]|uniref:Aminotransferase class V domain-containing protein n=1 Tax=Rotaria socialis TaxID=392032 RepID=A0A817UA58_9BILA|nr:unnamed protein product [Rotaria socialis]CAF3330952.1 unnamed protein product [Rotaria socialis]CAF4295388.1 unnamed protein product [Rotaria socialis]CAF4504833.1 unnamed protein product [Rotaria socialis]
MAIDKLLPDTKRIGLLQKSLSTDQKQSKRQSSSEESVIYLNGNNVEPLQYIDSNIIGNKMPINTPWGSRPLIYADYTASGRCLQFIVQYMLTNVLPFYANTHSENNVCAHKTTKFREDSRKLIKKCVNASDDYVLIFTGSGSTAAIHQLINVLDLRNKQIQERTIVFISTFEHHSNILPWKETGIEIKQIPNNEQGLMDLDNLKQQLKYYHKQHHKHIICSFNAGSNVTGILTDVDTVSKLVHKYDGWIFWDYAAAAPYVKIDMNPSKIAYKDAVFISTHKFVGGPGTPGILVAKKHLFDNQIPSGCGGGTVNFVTRNTVEYVRNIETREEGGTPNILGSIQAGLVFHLKQFVGEDRIELRENELVDKCFEHLPNSETLCMLGPRAAHRLAIFSFLIYVPKFKKYLHHNFVCVLLNDLFGIQVRSGCACAGPYVLDLLNIKEETAKIYAKFITEDVDKQDKDVPKNALMKPGFTRFNLSYFASDSDVDYIIEAIRFTARYGWKFLPLYEYNVSTAAWGCRDMPVESAHSQDSGLQGLPIANGPIQEPSQNNIIISDAAKSLIKKSSKNHLKQAKNMAKNIPEYVNTKLKSVSDPPLNIPEKYEKYIWFLTPETVIKKFTKQSNRNELNDSSPVPFRPKNLN